MKTSSQVNDTPHSGRKELQKARKYQLMNVLSGVVSVWPKLCSKIVGIYFQNSEQLVMRALCQGIENERINIAFRVMPNDSLLIPTTSVHNATCMGDRLGIVLQGPIPDDVQFICDSIRFYQKIYSTSVIIVSTWDDEDAEKIRAVRNLGVTVVQSAKPTCRDSKNLNFQLVNSLAGVRKAKEMNCEYVVKTRTDQRICRPYLFDNMRAMVEKYPPYPQSPQHKRLVVLAESVGNTGNMFAPYFMSDYLYFGQIDDIVDLFSAPLDERQNFDMPDGASRREYAEETFPPEIAIVKQYLKNHVGYDCEITVKAWWEAVRRYLICYSKKEADLRWPKYNHHYELDEFYGEYYGDWDSPEKMLTMRFDFLNWLELYHGTITYREEFEQYADVAFLFASTLRRKREKQ